MNRGYVGLVFRVACLCWVMACLASCSQQAKHERSLRRGEDYFRAGKYDEARIEFLNVLSADRDNLVAIRRLGEIWQASGSRLQALRYLMTAQTLAPEDVSIRTKLGQAYFAVGYRWEARKAALEALKRSPESDDAILLLADTAMSGEEVEEAQQRIQAVSPTKPALSHLASASLLLRKGDVKAVNDEIEQALALDPKSLLGHLAMANVWWSKGDVAQAEAAFKKALALSQPRSSAVLKYAEFKIKTGAVEDAKRLLGEQTQATKDFLPAWNLLAQIAMDEKKYDEALEYLTNVLGRDGSNLEARILQATVWIARGQATKAERSLEDLDKEQPRLPLVKFQLARAYLQNRRLDEASKAINEVVSTHPGLLDAVLLQANVNLRRGDVQAVAASMESLLKKQPNLLQPQLMLVEAYRSLARLDEAVALLRQQIASAPDEVAPHFLLGVVLRQKRQLAEARPSLEKAYELAPDSFPILSQLIELDLDEKRFDQALGRTNAEMAKNPRSAAAYYLLGRIRSAQNEWAAAETALLKSLELDANFLVASEQVASIYLVQKRVPEALAQYDRILSKDPNNAKTLKVAALICDQNASYEDARKYYVRYVAVEPNDQSMLNNLAYLYSERFNELDKAHDLVRKARLLGPLDPGTADTLGWILFKKGDYTQALAMIQEGAARVGDNPEVQYHLGMANYMMNQAEPARAALQKALGGTADFPGKNDIKIRLDLLDGVGQGTAQPVEVLERLVKDFPKDVFVRIRLGEALANQKDYSRAVEQFDEASRLNPLLVAPVLKLAQLYQGPLGDREKAVELAKKARRLAPTDPQVGSVLGKLVYDAGSFAWAYSLFQESSSQSNAPIELRNYAWAAYSLGKVDEARALMRRAGETANEKDIASFLELTAITSPPTDAVAAEALAQGALRSDSGHVPALMVRAELEMQRDDPKAAAATYEQVLVRFPDFTPAQKRLAVICLDKLMDFQKGYELAKKAWAAAPNDLEVARALGRASYERKEYAYAVQLLQESARQTPLEAQDMFYLGMAQHGAKNPKAAVESLKGALSAGLTFPKSVEAQRIIESAGGR
jgi:tetratricopeptide (TPR) repeat protein